MITKHESNYEYYNIYLHCFTACKYLAGGNLHCFAKVIGVHTYSPWSSANDWSKSKDFGLGSLRRKFIDRRN